MPILSIITCYSWHCICSPLFTAILGLRICKLHYPVSFVLSTNESPQYTVRGGEERRRFISSSLFQEYLWKWVVVLYQFQPRPWDLLLGSSSHGLVPLVCTGNITSSFVSINLRVINNFPTLLISELHLHSLFLSHGF